MTTTHTFVVLNESHQSELSRLIEIYQEAIDPSEQKTPAEITAMVADPRYALMVSITRGEVSGFSICLFPPGADFFLLEYMAIAAASRGKRVGEALFAESYRYGSARAADTMVLEVDMPGSSSNPDNDTEGRYRFYRRMECRRIDGLTYILPLETASTPPPMMLLVYRVPAVVSLDCGRLRTWLETIYETAYGKPRNDARITKMLAQAARTLAALPL